MSVHFNTTEYKVQHLVEKIEMGEIALPYLQRPFVWTNDRVRDLFDSLFSGFPVGYLLLWNSDKNPNIRNINIASNKTVSHKLIIDGQQRLTALFSVIKGKKVLDKSFNEREIKLAFNPLTSKFQVSSFVIKYQPEFISDISIIWNGEKRLRKIGNEYIENLRKIKDLTKDEEDLIDDNLEKLENIGKYTFSAVELSHAVADEVVSEIFVRINSKGVSLKQSDFVLTLLSVYWEEGRQKIEEFCRFAQKPSTDKFSPFNYIIQPTEDQIIRVIAALAFKKGSMKDVYNILKGKDVFNHNNDLFESITNELSNALRIVLDNTNWHTFIKTIVGYGYKSDELISAKNTLLFAYSFFLIGKEEFKINYETLQKLIIQWFIFSSITGRYSGATDATFETDLNRIKDCKNGNDYIAVLSGVIDQELNDSYWSNTLVNDLVTSNSKSPMISAYFAAQNFLGVRVLFSAKNISDLFDPAVKTRKKRLDKHHLFPKNYLVKNYLMDPQKNIKEINQVANFAYLEFEENINIKDLPPHDYMEKFKKRYSHEDLTRMYSEHALPIDWENLEYNEFLAQRRKLIASFIRTAFEKI
jgi:hypothetical protein